MSSGTRSAGSIAAVLFEAAVLAEIVAVIGHVDDEGVVVEAEALEGIEHAADVAVEEGGGSVVCRNDAALIVVREIAEYLGDLPGVLGAHARYGELFRVE